AAGTAPLRALPRRRDRGRLLAPVSRARRGGERARVRGDQRLGGERRVGGHGAAEAGAVDAARAAPPARAAARGRGRGVRLPRGPRLAGAALDAARGARVELSPLARAATAVAALRALQPDVHRGLRAPVRAPPSRRRCFKEGMSPPLTFEPR